jgi:hypothetical protein
LPSLIGQSEIKGISSKDPSDEFKKTSAGSNFPLSLANKGIEKSSNYDHAEFKRITCAGSNFLGLTAERWLAPGVDGGAIKGAAYPLTLDYRKSRKLAAMVVRNWERITCAGSNFLGLTAERLLDSRVDARTMPEAACPLTLADRNSRILAATSRSE